MNNTPLLIILESTLPTMSEYLAIKYLLRENSKIFIGIKNDNSLMSTNKAIEMWFLAFSEFPKNIKLIIIPMDYMNDMDFQKKLKIRFKRIAIRDKKAYVYFATTGFEMVTLPYIPGYEPLFLANAYRQSIAFRFLEAYGK